MALERRTCMLKVTSEIYVYNNKNIGYDIGYDIGYRDNIEVFSFNILGKSSILYLDIRTPFLQFYNICLLYRVRYRSFSLQYRRKISFSDMSTLLKHPSCHSSILKVKTKISISRAGGTAGWLLNLRPGNAERPAARLPCQLDRPFTSGPRHRKRTASLPH
jgi:hypothetical protein